MAEGSWLGLGYRKQEAVLCFPLALQLHEQEIPAQKGPGKG